VWLRAKCCGRCLGKRRCRCPCRCLSDGIDATLIAFSAELLRQARQAAGTDGRFGRLPERSGWMLATAATSNAGGACRASSSPRCSSTRSCRPPVKVTLSRTRIWRGWTRLRTTSRAPTHCSNLWRAFSDAEVAVMLGLHRQTLAAAIRRGELPSVRIGRKVLVPSEALDRLLCLGAAHLRRRTDDKIRDRGPRQGHRPLASAAGTSRTPRTDIAESRAVSRKCQSVWSELVLASPSWAGTCERSYVGRGGRPCVTVTAAALAVPPALRRAPAPRRVRG
jgi:excisionase family DNA binding protein